MTVCVTVPALILAFCTDEVCVLWVGGKVARLVRVGTVAPSLALGVRIGRGSCKDPNVKLLSTPVRSSFRSHTGEAGYWKSLLEHRQELKGPGASLQLWVKGMGELGVMGGFVLVMLLEPKTCACCTLKPLG